MLLRLGAVPALVVSSPRAAEAVLRTHDHVFASRPFSALTDVLVGSGDVGFAPYGEQWRKARKLITTHLLSVKKVQSLRLVREEEVAMAMAKISESAEAGEAVDMGQLFIAFTNDVVCRAVSGRLFRKEGQNKMFQELVRDTSQLLGGFNIGDYYPGVVARVGVLRKATNARAERLRKRWDKLLDKVIDEHEREYDPACDHKDDDFTNVLLSVKEEYGLTRDRMKALLIDVFFGTTDTASEVLEFTVSELMRCTRSMMKLQAEVRSSTPEKHKIVTEADMNGMVYLRAVIKESLRLHPAAPLLAPHFSMASCTIDGYTVPAGTRVLINNWAISRDARFWEHPEEFVPERFMEEGSAMGVDFKGSDFQYLPFGSGRRMCPGMNFGVATVEMMLANLVRRFDWVLPPGATRVDMAEVFGLTVRRKERLLLVPKLRL